MSRQQRSRVMSRIKGRNTTPEIRMAQLLTAGGVEFSQHGRHLPGCPDLVFSEEHVVVFINGDFWHGWRFPSWAHRLSAFWRKKIEETRRRDSRIVRRLGRAGWRVIRIWEHQVEGDSVACVDRIARVVGGSEWDWNAIGAKHRELPLLKRRNRLPKP
jgi:DNA mismatch endonuclease, patch repair protein